MVTRIYTPMIPPYTRPAGQQKPGEESRSWQNAEQGTDNRNVTPGIASSPVNPMDGRLYGHVNASNLEPSQEHGRLAQTMATVQDQALNKRIPMHSILQDFRSTMDALGASEPVRNEVNAYLGVIELQSQKQAPSVPFIKQTLRTSADSLDSFITDALGQPSRVVRDWVDALLMQNIDYHEPGNGKIPAGHPETKTASGNIQETRSFDEPDPLALQEPESPQNKLALTPEDKQSLKQMVESGKTSQQAGNWQQANQQWQQGLELLKDKGRPDLEGKLYHLQARLFEERQQPSRALELYSKAHDAFAESGQIQKQARTLASMAAMADRSGQMSAAKDYYERSLNLERTLGNTRGIGHLYNDLGGLQLRMGNAGGAIETFRKALTEASRPEGEHRLIPDIFSNLAAGHKAMRQYPQALEAYKASLDHAYRLNDKPGYVATLQQMAGLYQEAGKPEKANALLSRARTLTAKIS